MDYSIEDEVDDGEEDDLFFIEGSSSSENEEEMKLTQQKSCKQAARLSRESSPPLLLAFPISSGRAVQDSEVDSSTDSMKEHEEDSEHLHEEQEENSDQPIEDWMILDGDEQVEDSSIQLNLTYWNSSEDDFRDEDLTDENEKPGEDNWAVSEKDKYGVDQSLVSRYFAPGRSLICHRCNKLGHLAQSCYLQKKRPTCILCGIQGHIQRDCPGRPCPTCGRPSHDLRLCEVPSVWNQHCQRCGMTGHLTDACPDTWRQYHLTIRLEVPVRPRTVHKLKHKRSGAHCYNCSKRGHYGYECTRRRMVSGTFPSLPYVCHYDTMEDILQHHTRMQGRDKELVGTGSRPPSDPEHLLEKKGEGGEKNQSVQGRSRMKQDSSTQARKRKTWPERRRERREVKRLKREAQAMREGGILRRSSSNSDDEVSPADPFRDPLSIHWQPTPPQQKKSRDETSSRKSKKIKKPVRLKKGGGIKQGELYPYSEVKIESEKLFSPKKRVRHRRR